MNDGFKSEYESFLAADANPPATLESRVQGSILSSFRPRLSKVLGKTGVIYFLSGLFVLLICPQLGLTLIADHGIMHAFMFLGVYGCMAACGALFLGTGALFTSLLLSPEELYLIRHHRLILFPTFGLVALAIVIGFGSSVLFGIALAWWLGTLVGESAGFEFGWRLRNLSYATGLIDSKKSLS